MKVCTGHPQTWLPSPLLIHWSVYAPNDSLSSTREEENDGVVRLPNRCCQERTAAAGRSYHLVLCHLHPSGLCFRSDLVKTVLLERTHLCPYITLQFFAADWISALSPSPSQHGRKRGFWDPGAGFYGLWYLIICLPTRCRTQRCFMSPRPVSVRGQTALPQPENQRARQPSGGLALWHQRCDTCLICLVNTVNSQQYISAFCLSQTWRLQ